MNDSAPLVVYCAADLLWASKIKGTGDAVGVHCRPVRDVGMLEARLGDSRVVGAVIDLEAGEAGRAVLERLRGAAAGPRERAVRVVVFGPHVEAEGLRGARAAGADAVLTRGALNARLGEVLRELAANERDPGQ